MYRYVPYAYGNYQQQGNTIALRWDSGSRKTLMKKDMIPTFINTVGLIVGGPILKIAHLAMIFANNPFKTRARKAKVTGKILAKLIASKRLGDACITLIGFSLGTRVIYYCLRKLSQLKCSVHDVILLGGAAPCKLEKWKICRNVAAGRLINAYSKTDKLLSKLYAISRLEKAIGNWPIEVNGIENYDVTDIATGHLKYSQVLDLILKEIEYNIK